MHRSLAITSTYLRLVSGALWLPAALWYVGIRYPIAKGRRGYVSLCFLGRQAPRKAHLVGFRWELTDSVLLFLGTCFFLVFLLRSMSIIFRGAFFGPAQLTRALSRWLPRAMARVEVSAMKGNRDTQRMSAESSAMNSCLSSGPDLRVVENRMNSQGDNCHAT